ncbi:TMhelix containing protein [Vibrio phage 1.022.O._10N.286.45.A10]|nr:TMhelix containing protein [Vibrio phage 1.022.O._10N.286.45.A10]
MVKALKRIEILLLWMLAGVSLVLLLFPSLIAYVLFGKFFHEGIADKLVNRAFKIEDSLQD